MKPIQSAGYYVFGWVSRVLVTLLFSTCRITVFGREIERRYLRENPGKGLLYASWHRGLIFFAYFYRFLSFVILASASKDGEFAAQGGKRFGWIVVRGSSSRRGIQALREMEVYFRQGCRGGLVVDGPQGPRCVSKIGIIALAKRTGLPILPVIWSADRSWRLGSWDRTIIPKPFSRIGFLYGSELIQVPGDATREECDGLRQELDDVLNTMMCQTDRFHGTKGATDPRQIVVVDPGPE